MWVFLPAALVAYYSALRYSVRAANRVLALSGYVFYAWSSPKFLVLLWATTAIDWVAGLIIAGDSWRFWRLVGRDADTLESGGARSMIQRRAITTSVVVNLASLGFFKYAGFPARSAREIATSLGLAGLADHPTLHIILPLGISFYTFQSLSYTIDVYRGQKVARGIALFSLGMAKKVALANPSGAMADALFSAQSIGSGDAWAGAVGTRCKSISISRVTRTWRSALV